MNCQGSTRLIIVLCRLLSTADLPDIRNVIKDPPTADDGISRADLSATMPVGLKLNQVDKRLKVSENTEQETDGHLLVQSFRMSFVAVGSHSIRRQREGHCAERML